MDDDGAESGDSVAGVDGGRKQGRALLYMVRSQVDYLIQTPIGIVVMYNLPTHGPHFHD